MTPIEAPKASLSTVSSQRRSFDFQKGQSDDRILDKELQKKLNQLSQELLVQMHTLLRMLNSHARENEATQKVLLKFHGAIKQLFETEYELHIEFTGSDFIINEHWVRLPRQLQDLSSKLGEHLQGREIGGLWFTSVPQPHEILHFIRTLLAIETDLEKKPFARLQNALWNQNIEWVSLEKYVETFDWDSQGTDIESYIRQIYFAGIQATQQIYLQASQNKPLKLKAAKRSIQAFVELFCSPRRSSEADFLLLLTHVKNALHYRYNYAVNTAILAIGFAHHLGFQRKTLRDVGIAALFYDIGMSQLPANIEYQDDLQAAEQKAYEAHPALAVPMILNTTFVDSSIMRAVNVAFAHHLGYKQGGYPAYGHSVQSPISQLISIIDQYNKWTTPHPQNTKLISPPQALGELTLTSNPILIRKFIEYMGTLPIGTLVQLNTGDIGYVKERTDEQRHPMRPLVKILLSDSDRAGHILDLQHKQETGQHPFKIVQVLDLGHTSAQQALLKDLLL